ncbi:hypothetical protein NP493_884g02000 [Ridgeia piscesae]|uniref:Galactosylceramide sulfotransferase-like n=1 Tax=Ridgeia piscesae TaxID=27915 RepID=A0AAD9NLU3_RIDPI|nr:hypothetical protein NP493_884g02000 [Ridgeia piscesae]
MAVPIRTLPPQDNIVYIKTHKCASETLSAIFRRYGYVRNLSFVLPVDGRNNLGWPEPLDPGMYRPSKTGTYNILCEHTILTLPHMADIMPNDTMFITGIRDPFEHMKSAFHYFNIQGVGAVNGSNPLTEYLRHLDKYDAIYKAVGNKRRSGYCVPAHLSMTQNSIAFDLGFPTGFAKGTKDQTRNATAVQEWLDMLDKRMDFVLIVEYFDMSLVMLRRTLRWNTKDILYIRRNTQSYKVAQKIDEQLLRNYKVWSHVDYLLYDQFNKTLWQKVAQQSDDFWDECRDFDSVLNKTREFCNAEKHRRNESLQFPAKPWSDSFNVTAKDCAIIKRRVMKELRRQYDQIKVPVKYRKRSGQTC